VTLKARSSVGGEVIAVGGEVTKEEGASVAEKITQVYMPHFIPSLVNFMKGRWIALWATISLLALLGLLGLAILITALAPDHIAHTVNSLIRSFPTALLWGLLWAILIVPVIVLLAISIVGIILIPVVIFLVGLALICGYIAASIFIGKKVLASVKRHPFPFAEVITGILILFLIGFLPVAGALVKAVFLIAGFGAVITTRFGTIK
jgi:hypothetical protein